MYWRAKQASGSGYEVYQSESESESEVPSDIDAVARDACICDYFSTPAPAGRHVCSPGQGLQAAAPGYTSLDGQRATGNLISGVRLVLARKAGS